MAAFPRAELAAPHLQPQLIRSLAGAGLCSRAFLRVMRRQLLRATGPTQLSEHASSDCADGESVLDPVTNRCRAELIDWEKSITEAGSPWPIWAAQFQDLVGSGSIVEAVESLTSSTLTESGGFDPSMGPPVRLAKVLSFLRAQLRLTRSRDEHRGLGQAGLRHSQLPDSSAFVSFDSEGLPQI